MSARCGALLGALFVAGCIQVNPADGAFVCGIGGSCPGGYHCVAASNTCWHDGHDVAASDMSPDLTLPSSCSDGTTDGDETDVDCGGPTCPACPANLACAVPRDCSTGSCVNQICQLASNSPKWLGLSMGLPQAAGPRAHFSGFVARDGLLMTVGGILNTMSGLTVITFDYKVGSGYQKRHADLPHARAYHSCSPGPDGRIYVVGGCVTGACSSNLVDAFDYASDTWNSPVPAANVVARRHAASAYAGGKLWLLGGFDGTNVLNSIEVYNPGPPDSWTKITTALPTSRYGLAAVTGADDRVYTIGGVDGTATTAPSLEIFDPKSTTFITGANMSIGRGWAAAVAAPDGRIYAIGGTRNQTSALATVEAYTPATNSWAPVAALNVPRWSGLALVGPDNRIYFMGGNTAGSPTPSSVIEVYGPAIALAPGAGTAGVTNVSVMGSNFAANAIVDFFVGDRTAAPVASGTSDSSGALSPTITLVIPAGAKSGSTKIFAVDRKSQYPAVATFLVQ